ncbi:MAG: insulinase family protein, partial [Campylobacter sp.]|nr:insulinase family protein [Campylobacter sp.]
MRKVLTLFFIILAPLFAFKLDENLTINKLDNGLTYYLYENDTLKNSVAMTLRIGAGSTDEKDSEQGIAHFVEHMAFNGTEDFSKNELIKALENLGVKFGADLNAMTSFNTTIYKLDIQNEGENLETAINVLVNMGFKVEFNSDDLEAEKGVIIAEDKNRQNASQRIFEASIPYYYKDSIYAKRLPIGDMDIIKGATPELMRGFYERYYQPDNAELIIVGDFNSTKMEVLIKEYFAKIKGSSVPKIDKPIGYFNETVIFNAHDKDIASQSINFMFESNPIKANSYKNIKELTKYSFISALISDINNERKSSGKTLIYMSFYPMDLYNAKRLNTFSLSVVDVNFSASVGEFAYIVKNVSQNGFSKSAFESIKKDFLAANLVNYEQSATRQNSDIMWSLLSYIEDETTFLSPKDSYDMNKKIIDEISIEDIDLKFKDIVSKGGVIISTISKDEVNITKDDIFEIYRSASKEETELKELPNTIFDQNLSAVLPIKTKFDEQNLVYTYEFANGAKLTFKHMDTDRDSIYFQAFKKGGYTNISSINDAIFAVNLSNGSGIGKYNSHEVNTITAGQIFNFKKYINKVSLGYLGSAFVGDLEDMFRAFYVEFENPKIDKKY